MGETTQIRSEVLEFCVGHGIDLGFGGDKVTPDCIGFDLPFPYTKVGYDLADRTGDARCLSYKDETFDYVYSSHLLEDFPNTLEVLTEWVRVLKPRGYLILYLPNEQRFREHCRRTGQGYNPSHSIEDMSLAYMLEVVSPLPLRVIKSIEQHLAYSFLVVFQKLEVSCEPAS